MKKKHLASLSKADEWVLTKVFLPLGKRRLQRILDAPDESILMYLYNECYQCNHYGKPELGGIVCAEAIALGLTFEDFVEFKKNNEHGNSWIYLSEKAEEVGIKMNHEVWEPFLYSNFIPKPWWAAKTESKDLLLVMNEIEVSLLKTFIKHRLMNYRKPNKWGRIILAGIIGLAAIFSFA